MSMILPQGFELDSSCSGVSPKITATIPSSFTIPIKQEEEMPGIAHTGNLERPAQAMLDTRQEGEAYDAGFVSI